MSRRMELLKKLDLDRIASTVKYDDVDRYYGDAFVYYVENSDNEFIKRNAAEIIAWLGDENVKQGPIQGITEEFYFECEHRAYAEQDPNDPEYIKDEGEFAETFELVYSPYDAAQLALLDAAVAAFYPPENQHTVSPRGLTISFDHESKRLARALKIGEHAREADLFDRLRGCQTVTGNPRWEVCKVLLPIVAGTPKHLYRRIKSRCMFDKLIYA